MLQKFIQLMVLCSLGLVFSACASVPMASLKDDQEAKAFAAPQDKSRIYIYRNESFGGAIKVSVAVDGKVIGQTAPKTYFVVDVAPGEHQVTCLAESNSQVTIKGSKGEEIYVWQEMKMGMMSAACRLHEVTAEVGKKGVSESKLAQKM